MQSSTSQSFDKQLRWTEPRGFRKTDLKGSWKSILGIIILTASATVVFLLISSCWLNLGAEMTLKLLITAGAIVILSLVLFGCTRLMQISVKITGKAFVWELGDTPTVYPFEAIDHCEICNKSFGGRTIPVLVIALKNGDRENFGIASSVSVEVLRSTLEQRSVNVLTRTGTMSEQVLAGKEGDSNSRIEHSPPYPFESIVDCLKKDGLSDQAKRFDELLHHVAWTTGTEMIGELGLEMKQMWPMVKARGSNQTKEGFRSAARIVRKSWPLFRL